VEQLVRHPESTIELLRANTHVTTTGIVPTCVDKTKASVLTPPVGIP
jgi:hypothetical protein